MQPSWPRPLQDVELVAEREDLKMESGAGPDDAAEHRQQGNQDGRHREQSGFGTVRTSTPSARTKFPVGTGSRAIIRCRCPAYRIGFAHPTRCENLRT